MILPLKKIAQLDNAITLLDFKLSFRVQIILDKWIRIKFNDNSIIDKC